MRSKSLQKILATTLTATMVMASALTVSATTNNAGSGSESSSSSSESSDSEESPATYAEQNSQSEDAAITVGNTVVKTSVSGVYAAKTVQGCAITVSKSAVAASLGLSGNQKAAIIIYDTDQKKSSKAMACVNAAIEAMQRSTVGNVDMVAVLNVDLGAKEDGKWVTLSSGSVGMKTGLPKGADTTKTYSVICVQPGGVITILEDEDTDPNTVTFAVQAGLGTYALVAQ